MPHTDFAIDPRHDPARLAVDYARKGRIQIRDFLAAGGADRVVDMLERQTPWSLAFNEGERVAQLSAQQVASLGPQQRAQMAAAVHDGARRGYQFVYSLFPLLAAYFSPRTNPPSPLFALFEWLNSAEFLGFARTLTGLDDIAWADGQATSFGAGHFLKYHTDETPSQKRRAAYVLNLTRDWGRDWGGFLQFFDEKYDIEEGLRPLFNAINIFTVPAHHSVSVVAPYVVRKRLSITGWLRADEPPAKIGGRG